MRSTRDSDCIFPRVATTRSLQFKDLCYVNEVLCKNAMCFSQFFLSGKILDPENAKEYEGRNDTRGKKITQMGGI